MSLEPDFLDMASTTVDITPPSTTYNDQGVATYSSSNTNTYPAVVEYAPRMVFSLDGRQQVASATIYVLSTTANISVQDQVVLSLATAPRMIRADPVNDDEGLHHWELMLG